MPASSVIGQKIIENADVSSPWGKYIDVHLHHGPYLEDSILFFIITCQKNKIIYQRIFTRFVDRVLRPCLEIKRVKLSPSITMDDPTKGSKSCRDLQSTPHNIKKFTILKSAKNGEEEEEEDQKLTKAICSPGLTKPNTHFIDSYGCSPHFVPGAQVLRRGVSLLLEINRPKALTGS